MDIRIKIQKGTIVRSTKEDVIRAFDRNFRNAYVRHIFTKYYSFHGLSDSKFIYVYSLQKVNKKTSQKKTKKKNEFGFVTKSTVITKKQWILTYFRIPIELYKLMDVNYVQLHNSYIIEKRKK